MRIETERLILREIDPERDFQPWASAMADEETVRYLGVGVMNPAQAWRGMASVIGHWAIEPSMALARKLGSELQSEQQGLPAVTDEKVFIFGQSRP